MSAAPRLPVGELGARLEQLYEQHRSVDVDAAASYYEPGRGYCALEQASASSDQFAIAVARVDGALVSVGDDELPFALQSVSKVFAYALALADHGREGVLARVGVEPTGEAFNSIAFDEDDERPHNPMVNAGAIATSDLIRGAGPEERIGRLLGSMRAHAGNPELEVDERTFEGEWLDGDRNRAIAYLMRSKGMIEGDVAETLEVYLRQCSVMVDVRDLATMAATLANGGRNPRSGERCLPRERVRDVLSVMYTCGMYDFAGHWAYEVGLPAKSGVSGALLCVVPGKAGIGIFSPGLDPFGNSVRGTRVCAEISERLGLHVFATEDEDEMLGGLGEG